MIAIYVIVGFVFVFGVIGAIFTNLSNKEEGANFLEGKNKVALIIKVLSILGGIIGFGYGCSLFDSSYTKELGIVYIIVSIVSAVFVYALGEIIQKLQNIEDNTKKI